MLELPSSLLHTVITEREAGAYPGELTPTRSEDETLENQGLFPEDTSVSDGKEIARPCLRTGTYISCSCMVAAAPAVVPGRSNNERAFSYISLASSNAQWGKHPITFATKRVSERRQGRSRTQSITQDSYWTAREWT